MLIYVLFFFIILYLFKDDRLNKISGGYYHIKKNCVYQSPDLNLKDKNYIGKITGNKSDFRDLSNNYYCNEPFRI
tara:strand:+ start:508 stop:732 length:225 start_codon:yes stop_codon:yes gene_type:complete